MSIFLNGFVDELTKTSGAAEDVTKPVGQTMEIKAPKPVPPPKPPVGLEGPKAVTSESKPGGVLAKTSSVGSALVASQVGKVLKDKLKGAAGMVAGKARSAGTAARRSKAGAHAESAVFDARSLAARGKKMSREQWNKMTPKQQRAAKAAGVIGFAGTGLSVNNDVERYEKMKKQSSEDKAGSMVKEVVKNAKGKNKSGDGGNSMVDQYGGGLGNFEGKTAPKFNKKFNPTDMPQAFGKK